MRWPLRYQILLPMAGLMLLTLAVVSALHAWLASATVKKQLQQQLAGISRALAASNFPLESNVLRQMEGLTGAEFVAVDAGGKAIAASDETLIPIAEKSRDVPNHLNLSAVVTVADQQFFHVSLPILRQSAARANLDLHVFYSVAAWREARWRAVWPSLLIGGVSIVLVAIVVSVLVRQVTRPIQELHQQVGCIANGDFHTMAIPSRNDEVRDLATAVNQMAQRLSQYEEQIRASERLRAIGTLGGGIAHQIRNSATGCRIALDLLQRDNSHVEGNGRANETIGVAVQQLTLIEASVQRLLTLGKPATHRFASTNLVPVVESALDLIRPTARHMGVELKLQLPSEPALISADAQALTQLMVNLVLNGIEAAAQAQATKNRSGNVAPAFVEINLTQQRGDQYELAIGNSGPGPDAAIQARLFEPFATDKAGGTGLGLAVARQIAKDHGGSIRWQQRQETTWFLTTLPTSCIE